MTRRAVLSAFLLASKWDRREILEHMQLVMGSLPKPHRVRTELIDEKRQVNLIYRKIRFEAEPGDWVPAWMILPAKSIRTAVLCLHQTTRIGKDEPAGLGPKPNLHYARELAAEHNAITMAPDYPNFGEYQFDPYAYGYASATMKGIVNHMRAVDVLLKQPGVRRVAACGHSLGGHNSLFLAAFDTRVKAVIASCGFTSFRKYHNGDLTGWSHKGYMPRIAERYGKDPARMPFDFTDVLAAIAPRRLFINAPLHDSNFDVAGVRDCVEATRHLFGPSLAVEHPDDGHDFPPDVRRRAFAFVL